MSDAAALMDRMYRRQRHIYDLSRKYYLLGRDEAIARLDPAPGDGVLEIGCGTGRNLIKAAQAYPDGALLRPRRLARDARHRGCGDPRAPASPGASPSPRAMRPHSIRRRCSGGRRSSG